MFPGTQPLDRAAEVGLDARAIGDARPGDGAVQECLPGLHHRQVDQVAAERAVVPPTVGVGEQLARRHVERGQGPDAAHFVLCTRRVEWNSRLPHDLELDLGSVHGKHRSDAVLVGPKLTDLGHAGPEPEDPPEPGRPHQELTERAIPLGIRNQQADVHGLTIFAMAQRDGGAPAEQAVVGREERAVQGCEYARDPLVVGPLKQGGVRCPSSGRAPQADPVLTCPSARGRCGASHARRGPGPPGA